MEFLNEEGKRKLERELEHLIKVRRREISAALEESSSLGDLSENAEYQEAKEEQLRNEKRIAEIEDLLGRAVMIPASGQMRKRTVVEVGCFVVLKSSNGLLEDKYQIVGSWGSDPIEKKISHESPLGAAILGRKIGHKAKVLTPKGEIEYTIAEII